MKRIKKSITVPLPLEAVSHAREKKMWEKGMFFRGGRGMRGPLKGYQGKQENGIQIAMIKV